MCVLKLAKGILFSLITFSLGLGVVSLFISQEQTKTSKQSKTICVKDENPFEKLGDDGKMVVIPCEIDKEINGLEQKNIPQGFVKKVETQKITQSDEGNKVLVDNDEQKSFKERRSSVIGCGESFSNIYKDLYKIRKELKKEIALNYSIDTEKKLESIERQIQIVKDLELKQKSSKN